MKEENLKLEKDMTPVLLEDLGMRYPTENSKKKKHYSLYECPFCSNEFEAHTYYIKSGKQKSCGCLTKTHGLSTHRLYSIWTGMMARCYNMNTNNYINYGSNGIRVSERWHNVANFIEDMFPSFIEGFTLDRKDVTGNYEPNNCRWADRSTQAQNTRKLKSTNTSGYRGVFWHKGTGKWVVRISVNNKSKHLGCFTNPEEGARAYDQYIIDNNLSHTKNFD